MKTHSLGMSRSHKSPLATRSVLQASQAMFLALSESAPDGIFVSDAAGTILEVNRQACLSLGYTREELMGLNLGDFVPSFDIEEVRQLWSSVRPELPVTVATRYRRKTGEDFPVEVTLSSFRMHGRMLYLAMARDITEQVRAENERKLLEAELRQAEKLDSLGRLASGVAHDMNNVLAAILAVAQVVRPRLGHDPSLADALDTILKAGQRGRDMVRALTNFVRKDLRSAEPMDLNLAVRDEANLLQHTLRQKIRLQVELEPELPWIQGEPGNIRSALMNLCVNAVDAMPEGGTLSLRTRRLADDWLELLVEDTGEGMSAEVMGRALEPFFTTKPPGKGTGLGLAMVHGTVKSHGGSMEIQSEPGQGTRIAIRLPAIPAQAALPAPAPEAVPAAQGLRILLVDDDDLIRATIPPLLGFLGHRAVTVGSGEEALDLLAGGLEVDIVILDQNMPGLSGAATYRKLRPLRPALPVLLASGFLDLAAEELLASDPLAGTLAKPYLVADLAGKLQSFLGKPVI